MTSAKEMFELPNLQKGYQFDIENVGDMRALIQKVDIDYAKKMVVLDIFETEGLKALRCYSRLAQDNMELRLFNNKDKPTGIIYLHDTKLTSMRMVLDGSSSALATYRAKLTFKSWTIGDIAEEK